MAGQDAKDWIISMLLGVTAAVLWFILMETRTELAELRTKFYDHLINHAQHAYDGKQQPSN